MNRAKLVLQSLLSCLGVWAYTALVAWLLFNGSRFFGPARSFFIPLAMLLLFVFSATVVGLLVLGRPAWLYLAGAKREALHLLLYTLAGLLILTLITFSLLYRMSR